MRGVLGRGVAAYTPASHGVHIVVIKICEAENEMLCETDEKLPTRFSHGSLLTFYLNNSSNNAIFSKIAIFSKKKIHIRLVRPYG